MEADIQTKKQQEKGQTKSHKNSQQQSIDSKRSSSQERTKKKNCNQRSRSRNKRRSRSKQSKKKHKHKHKSSKYRSRSRSSSRRRRQKSRDKKRDKDRQRRQQRDRQYRGRSRQKRKQRYEDKKNVPTEIPMPPIPNEISMPLIPGQQRRRRQRSRSPLDYYRKNQNNNEGQFWDSFSWVPRMNYTPNVSTSALANTKKMRRLMITNIPYEIGITEDNLRDIITRFMSRNYLKDQMNNCPVVNLQINQTDHNVSVELSSVEETCRMCRMQKIELFQGFHNGIVRLGDSIYGNNVLTQAQTAGTAQAAAFAAINVLENKKTNFNVETGPTFDSSSTVMRITNAVTPYMATHMNEEQWQDYYEDLIEGFSQYGTIVHDWFVKTSESDICSDAGNLFVQYEYKQNAQAAMAEMQNRIYDERSIKLYYWPRDLYYKNFRPKITPPILPAPLKTVKQTK